MPGIVVPDSKFGYRHLFALTATNRLTQYNLASSTVTAWCATMTLIKAYHAHYDTLYAPFFFFFLVM